MNNINSNYSPKMSFGMALHMDEEEIGRCLGDYAKKSAKKARPTLENDAKNVDIFVTPQPDSILHGNLEVGHFEIKVQEASKSTNPIKNFFMKEEERHLIDTKPFDDGYVLVMEGRDTTEELINTINNVKMKFLQSLEVNKSHK